MSSRDQIDYPRPDFHRRALRWESLNGPWDFIFDDEDEGSLQLWQRIGLPDYTAVKDEPQANFKRTIQVPFVFQARASGINNQGVHEVLWYERFIEDIRTDTEKQMHNRLLLRFGAVDYHAKVWVNGEFVGEHRGGHVPFDLDITETLTQTLTGRHRLTVRVYDSAYDLMQPRGKQYWKPKAESIFYTPSSGIWQSVWIESVPNARIADSSHGTILRSNDIESGYVDCRIKILGKRVHQTFDVQVEAGIAGVVISKSEMKKIPKDEDFVRFNHNIRLSEDQLKKLPSNLRQRMPLDDSSCWRNGLALWTPEQPLLYDLMIRMFDSSGYVVDEVTTSVGMRSIAWTNGAFKLNGRPYFQALLLDQGYWPDTLMTAPGQSALRHDIELSKKMGFNGCRKHQKVEDPVFMYWADKLGFLVWGEMASCYRFSVDSVERFSQEWTEMVQRDLNHPCIVAWTPVNESWGYPDLSKNGRQRDHIRSLYFSTKTLDPTRPINDNSGWEHVITDLSTFQDYADANGMAERCKSVQSILERGRPMFLREIHGPDGKYDEGSKHQRGSPIICTEFGGVNIASSVDPGRKENWGYTTATDSQDLLKRLENNIMATVQDGHVCGVVWTQFTDIEQEQNGLYTFDRREKLPPEQVKAVIDRARLVHYSHQNYKP